MQDLKQNPLVNLAPELDEQSDSEEKVANTHQKNSANLPPIPDKLYFTIGEASQLCDLRPHVLRYWEEEFPQISPAKRRGNRRYYQYHDIVLLRRIKNLLYVDGFTIEGARQKLAKENTPAKNAKLLVKKVANSALEPAMISADAITNSEIDFNSQELLKKVLGGLEELLLLFDSDEEELG